MDFDDPTLQLLQLGNFFEFCLTWFLGKSVEAYIAEVPSLGAGRGAEEAEGVAPGPLNPPVSKP